MKKMAIKRKMTKEPMQKLLRQQMKKFQKRREEWQHTE
jgi:hypothetical protein